MNKVVSKLFGGLFLASLVAGLGVSISNSHKAPVESFAIGNYSTNASTYYNGITASSGKQLAAQLHDLITSTHRYYTSYADNGKNAYQQQTDQYYENDQKVSGYIYEFYSGVKWPNGWYPDAGDTKGGYNREHCWCQSNSVNNSGTPMWGETGGGADMHHLRPVETRLNSTRNNHPYGTVSNRDSKKSYAKYGTNETYAHGGYTDNNDDVFEPLDSKKGDVARIILYTYLHYNSYTVNDLFGGYGTTNGSGNSGFFSSSLLSVTKIMKPSTEAAALEMLLEWNNSDPVDELETRRNEQVAIYQGNRNPFIDNSNYANLIWGSGTTPTSPTVNSVTVSPSTLDLDVNGTNTGTLTATVTVSNGAPQTVTWTSSNTKVATVSDDGVVTAVAKGTCIVTATSTYNTNKSASCSVKVADTSGSGTVITTDVTVSTTMEAYAITNSWEDSKAYDEIELDSVTTIKSTNQAGNNAKYYSNGTDWRFYQVNSGAIEVSVKDGYSLKSIKFIFSTKNNGILLDSNNNSVTSEEAISVSGTSAAFSVGNSGSATNGQVRFTSISVTYSYDMVVSAVLSSISLNTSNVQTEFYIDDTFDSSGLVVTAYYDNGTEDIVTPTSVSSPDMTSTGEKTVTVSYTEGTLTKTADYTINVIEKPITSIFATVEKSYHPGDVISVDDIYVENDLGEEVTSFEFADDGYQFTYDDAPSGGSVGTKTFVGSVTAGDLNCDVTVGVSRVAYQSGSITVDDTLNRSLTGVTGTTYTSWSGKISSSGVVYAGQSAGGNSSIQLRSDNKNSGIIVTSNPNNLPCLSITVTWNSNTSSGRTIDIYGKSSAYTSPTDLYSSSSETQGTQLGFIAKGTTSLTITGEYPFIGIRSRSGALYLSSIVLSYPAGDTASNVANFIMINDTDGQCETKLDEAITKLNTMSASEKNTFNTSNDYVIATARTRLNAWAAHEGKILTLTDDVFTLSAGKVSLLTNVTEDNQSLMIVMICFVALFSGASAYCFIKKRNEAYR